MAFQARGRRERREQDMGLCNWIVAIVQVLVAFESITFISVQGYLHSETEFQSGRLLRDASLFPKYPAHGVTSQPHDKTPGTVNQGASRIKFIRFEPPYLDFGEQCVSMPKLRTVYIINPNKEKDLQLSSISARTSHFHASFFDKKVIPAGGNTSFEVVFLARVVGNVENTLFINTMAYGAFPYQVFGVGIPNPYRLRPFFGAKVPINSSFSPLISMHNPTGEPLQVTEMYSSSGFLQLQLPHGQQEGSKEQWEIPPYETRDVIRARFMGQVEANHTAFIRIKTAQTENPDPDFHILPMEVEVSSVPGIYSALELLDFGTLRTRYDEPKILPLFLLNSGDRDVQINSVTLSSPNPAIQIQFKPMKLKPSDTLFVLVANVTFSAVLAVSAADQKGSIIVKSREKSYSTLEIPFVVNLLDGILGYDPQAVLFHVDEPAAKKEIKLSNYFKFPVMLQNLSLSQGASKIFKVLDSSLPFELPVSTPVTPFSIQYDPGAERGEKSVDGTDSGSLHYLTLQTNASKFSLPLHAYSGMISYEVLQEDNTRLNFGVMGTTDRRQILFAVHNRNPTIIVLEEINSVVKNIRIDLVSLTQGGEKNLTEEADFQLKNFSLPSNSCSVFEVVLTSSETEESILDSIKIVTKYQEIAIPVLARIVVGTLTVKPEKVKFPRSFPGLIVHQTLSVINTFAQSTKLEYVHSKQIDKRFYYKKLKNQGLMLEPNKKAKVGKVYFDARQSCKPDRCYVGLPTSTTAGHHWLTTLSLGPDSTEFDSKRYNEHVQRWRNLQSKGLVGPNTTLVLSSDVAMNVEVPVQATLYWPSLLEEESFQFPLTHIGRISVATLTVVNPADAPVIVQVLPLSLYPDPGAALTALGWSDKLEDESFITNNSSVFHLLHPKQETLRESMASQMVWLEYTLNQKLNHTVVNLFLDPGDRVDLKVEFVPYDDNPKSTVILLRNNLTILDVLPMHGRGAYEHLTLGGKDPNLPTSLLRFKLTKDLLKDCTRKKTSPSFTVRKWFHANNTGMLPIHITSMTVSGSPCEGYGFRVLDCDQFILQPNTSKKIEIAYTPDFTSYLVLHELKLVTAQGNEMRFTLNVTLPSYLLPVCQEAVPRPSWEASLHYFIVSVMLGLLGGILLMAYLEAINIWAMFVRTYELQWLKQWGTAKIQPRAKEEFGKPFDLRNVNPGLISTAVSTERNSTGPAAKPTLHGRETNLPTGGRVLAVAPIAEPDDVKHDTSQQTDPHPDFPPLPSSFLSPAPKGLFLRFLSFFWKKEKPRAMAVAKTSGNSIAVAKKLPCLSHSNSGSQLQHVHNFHTEKRKNDKKFRALDNVSLGTTSDSLHSKPTAEIRPVAKPLEVSKRKEYSIEKNDPLKAKDDSGKRKNSECEDPVVAKGVAQKRAQERRRSRSKSSHRSRESTSSSSSTDAQDNLPKAKSDHGSPGFDSPMTKVVEVKPLRGKKFRRLAKKQAKAQDKGTQEKEKFVESTPEKAVFQPPLFDKDRTFVGVVEPRKIPVKKLPRQQNRRASSPLPENQAPQCESAAAHKPFKKAMSVDQGFARRSSSKNENDSKPITKRRSYSMNADVKKLKDKPAKITIFKRLNGNDQRFSSSQEISESSSSESVPLWETPSQQHRDVDEDMRIIAKQSQQAELLIGADQKRAKGGKGTASPDNLTSGSRSSSYSSIISSGSSNDGGATKPQIKVHQTNDTPTKKLSRSVSEGGPSGVAKPQRHRRSPYPVGPGSADAPIALGQRDLTAERNASPPAQPVLNKQPLRANSSPSMFVNSFGCRQPQQQQQQQQQQQRMGSDYVMQQSIANANAQWAYQDQMNATRYSAFGTSQFNLMENLISSKAIAPVPMTATWESPFADSSSLYSTPSPPHRHNPSPPRTLNMRRWNSSGSSPPLLPSPVGYGQQPPFDPLPGTPTTPGISAAASPRMGWGNIPSPTTGANMTTHSIWSVSNAVTMDENRNTDECDPLGVRSIWSNAPHHHQNLGWHNRR